MSKVVSYECRGCGVNKERKEFHYNNFENQIPRKLCWGCEKENIMKQGARNMLSIVSKEVMEKDELITKLSKKISILEKQNNISVAIPGRGDDTKIKHKSLNLYMEPDNKEDAWFKHKGSYRKYKTYPNQYIEGDVCVVVKRPYGGNKYYGLQKMYQWIMEDKPSKVTSDTTTTIPELLSKYQSKSPF